MAEGWKLFADRGGTFTDIVALDPEGKVHFQKILSRTDRYDDPVMAGMKQLLRGRENQDSDMPLQDLRVGTTIGTNALLEHKIARVGLLVTSGFGDLLRIGYQARPSLFALRIDLPSMLYHTSATVRERMDSKGQPIIPLDIDSLNLALDALLKQDVQCLAVLFLHSNRNPSHELLARRIIQGRCALPVYLSHESSPMPGAVARGDTTLVDAALGPMIQDYSRKLQAGAGGRLHFMGSAGALIEASEFSGKDSLLSGPAGGVRAVARLCSKLGIERAVGFDMGGTSTDVFTFEGELQRLESTDIAGFRIQAPHLRIHTIASGGGSILRREGRRLLVGPESAGAYPGPAFYKRGGPATITDANAVLGRVIASHFPAVFGPRGNEAPDIKEARHALNDLRPPAVLEGESGFANAAREGAARNSSSAMESSEHPLEELAQGFLAIACEQMAGAVRKMTIEQGRDPAQYALVSFGGAGGQVACEVAERAGLAKVVFPGLAGLFSAVGIAASEPARMETVSLEGDLRELYDQLKERCSGLVDSGSCRYEFRLIPAGSDFPVPLGYSDFPALAILEEDFRSRYWKTYGYAYEGKIHVRSTLIENRMGESFEIPSMIPGVGDLPDPSSHRLFDEGWADVPLYARSALPGGFEVQGPALIASKSDTVFLRKGWRARLLDSGDLLAGRWDVQEGKKLQNERGGKAASDEVAETSSGKSRPTERAGPAESGEIESTPQEEPEESNVAALAISAEIHQRRLESIATEMGTVLQKTAQSVNIKERLDFSCAIFDAKGRILVSAPHIPVHLGSMQDSVQAILPLVPLRIHEMSEGFFVLNDPYRGGTHLPDITVIRSIVRHGEVAYFVAARGHHADVGGSSPGSMPARSRSIQEEGLLISPVFYRLSDLRPKGPVEEMFQRGGCRSPELNRADLAAQVAACLRGETLLSLLSGDSAKKESFLYESARESVFSTFQELLAEGQIYSSEIQMDPLDADGKPAMVALEIRRTGHELVFDFRKSSRPPVGNFQTPASVVRSAVLYCLYLVTKRSIPLNAGALDNIQILLDGTFLQAGHPMPVVAGNVETSQVLVDVILKALGVLSPGPGTMNNFSFGNSRYQYYETIGGGAGAGPDFAGASAIQCHMTNSRMTDVEILESRFPVLLEEFSIRRGSGGRGARAGGDGIIRQIRFLDGATVSLLSNRRRSAPPGIGGGGAGQPGRNLLMPGKERAKVHRDGDNEWSDGKVRILDYCDTVEVQFGDSLRIETPGGAGYGSDPGLLPFSPGESAGEDQ
ncbi:MAG: hydantoinase B/oxoprolinase family protein [Leptospiraceae bacterium]|nr:hydantoinase B/oxoprolinase family protein [Leptospiraceae bacterium]